LVHPFGNSNEVLECNAGDAGQEEESLASLGPPLL